MGIDPMDEPISAKYLWDPDAMAEALAAHGRHSASTSFGRLRPVVLLFYAVLSFGIPIWLIADERAMPETRRNAAIALAVAAALWTGYVVASRGNRWLRWNARRAFRSKPGGPELVEWSIGPDELHNRGTNSASILLWPLFLKAVEAPAGFLLYQNPRFFNWIPGHAFASSGEVRRFADLARARVANYVVLGECQFPAKPEPIGLDEF